jgi:hypothetical protein
MEGSDDEAETVFIAKLNDTYKQYDEKCDKILGYPGNSKVCWDEDVAKFLKVKNVGLGDPFSEDPKHLVPVASHEKEVVLFFAKLWNLSVENAWGYVTQSSSEAIMFGMWSSKQYFKS